jgi:hypothetical protein
MAAVYNRGLPYFNKQVKMDFGKVLNSFQLGKSMGNFDATLQNFIYKHTVDLENVQRNKKKEKGEFTGH